MCTMFSLYIFKNLGNVQIFIVNKFKSSSINLDDICIKWDITQTKERYWYIQQLVESKNIILSEVNQKKYIWYDYICMKFKKSDYGRVT